MIAVAIVLVVLWSTLVEWDWSFVDDPGQKFELQESIRNSGLAGGLIDQMQHLAAADWKGWGLFRPSWYVYAPLFYLTNPAIAHGLRLAMFLAVVLIPAVQFARRKEGYDLVLLTWGVCLFLANTTLYQGLTFLSLQELSGLALVSVGLLTSNVWGRSALWLLAAWMKTPFVWLFLAWGAFLCFRRRSWKAGALVVTLALATVVAAAVSARAGTYSSNFVISRDMIQMSVRTAIPLFYWPGLIGLLGLVALRPRLKTIAWRDPLALILAFGGVLYLANLLPWGRIGVYYGSPAVWLLSAAAVRYVSTAELARWRHQWRAVTAAVLIVMLLATGYLVTKIMRLQYQRNQAVVNMRTFALEDADRSAVFGINGSEAALRLKQIILLRDPNWKGDVVYVGAEDTTATPDYYIWISDEQTINTRLAENPIRTWAAATIYDP